MLGQINERILAPRLQRRLRSGMTDAERRLWSLLRYRQLDGCKFRRQHPYHDFVLDFVCLERKLVIEVDGGQHAEPSRDAARDAFLARGGFTTLRFWNHDVLARSAEVADTIYRVLAGDNRHHPHPGPPLEGE